MIDKEVFKNSEILSKIGNTLLVLYQNSLTTDYDTVTTNRSYLGHMTKQSDNAVKFSLGELKRMGMILYIGNAYGYSDTIKVTLTEQGRIVGRHLHEIHIIEQQLQV